jgi:hypothetical protein
MLGYSPGVLSELERCSDMDTALHIRFTRLAISLQLPSKDAAAAAGNRNGSAHPRGSRSCSSSSMHASDSALPSSAGFVDHSPEQGMSGGAVVDMHCGLWSIIESKSLWGEGGMRLSASMPTWCAGCRLSLQGSWHAGILARLWG